MEKMDKLHHLWDRLPDHVSTLALAKHFVGYLAVTFLVMLAIGVVLEFFHRRR